MNCPTCERFAADLGQPSQARWKGPDGEVYCSLHFINRFGHGEPLVRIEDFEAPKRVKAPALKKTARIKKDEEVEA